MISFNPFKKILDARKRHEKFDLARKMTSVYDAFIGNDNDQDRNNNYLGLFDYLTLFVPFAFNRLTIGLLNTPLDLPLVPMLLGMMFVVNCLAVAARHLLCGIITAALTPFVVVEHSISKVRAKCESYELPFKSSYSKVPFDVGTVPSNQLAAKKQDKVDKSRNYALLRNAISAEVDSRPNKTLR